MYNPAGIQEQPNDFAVLTCYWGDALTCSGLVRTIQVSFNHKLTPDGGTDADAQTKMTAYTDDRHHPKAHIHIMRIASLLPHILFHFLQSLCYFNLPLSLYPSHRTQDNTGQERGKERGMKRRVLKYG